MHNNAANHAAAGKEAAKAVGKEASKAGAAVPPPSNVPFWEVRVSRGHCP